MQEEDCQWGGASSIHNRHSHNSQVQQHILLLEDFHSGSTHTKAHLRICRRYILSLPTQKNNLPWHGRLILSSILLRWLQVLPMLKATHWTEQLPSCSSLFEWNGPCRCAIWPAPPSGLSCLSLFLLLWLSSLVLMQSYDKQMSQQRQRWNAAMTRCIIASDTIHMTGRCLKYDSDILAFSGGGLKWVFEYVMTAGMWV